MTASILTGVRVSTQMLMGIAAIAAFASWLGLGNQIFCGISSLGSANTLNEVQSWALGIVVPALPFDAGYVLFDGSPSHGGSVADSAEMRTDLPDLRRSRPRRIRPIRRAPPAGRRRGSIRPDSLTKRYPEANDPALVEAARGIGMSPLLTMFRVKLSLAVPLILAGMRPALVRNVGSATPATVGVGRGPWDLVSSGITSRRMPVLVLGSVLTVTMALIMDRSVTLVELLLRPRGLEVD